MKRLGIRGGAGAGFFVVVMLVMGLASCSARITGELREGGAAEIRLETALEPRMSALIRGFQALAGDFGGGAGGAGLILDARAIGRSMENAPGIASVALNNTGPAAIAGDIGIARVGDFLSLGAVGERRFIVYTETPAASGGGGSGSLVIYLDLGTAPQVISLLSADAVDYLSAIMAPVAPGEILSRGEYLSLVNSFYGTGIADEISAARIRASLDFPGVITGIEGGVAAGRRAEFDVALLDLLVLDRPLRYEVQWEER
jgi:hypothetical protein